MRFTITRLIVLTAVLLIPASIRPARSAEIEPSKSTHCTFDPDRLRLLPAVPRSPVTFDMLTAEQANRAQKIAALIQAKQWNPAFQEFQQATYWVQNITLRPLLAALVQANETDRAAQFLLNQFSPQSWQRAKGMGLLARELIHRNQLPRAIALLKTVPKDANSLQDAVIPAVETLTANNQIGKVAEVMAAFPAPETQWFLWQEIGNAIAFEPAQAQAIAVLIKHPSAAELRSQVFRNIAEQWLSGKRPNPVNALNIAQQIEDCLIRATTLVNAMNKTGSTLSNTQAGQILDQIEALTARLYQSKPDYQDAVNLQLSLAKLNLQRERRVQGIKLLEQVTQALKQVDFAAFRAEKLIELAMQYQSIEDAPTAVRLLDTAVTETHTAYQEETSPSYQGAFSFAPPERWREDRLTRIAKLYRSLNQPQKAAAIEQTLKQPAERLPPGQRPAAPAESKQSQYQRFEAGMARFNAKFTARENNRKTQRELVERLIVVFKSEIQQLKRQTFRDAKIQSFHQRSLDSISAAHRNMVDYVNAVDRGDQAKADTAFGNLQLMSYQISDIDKEFEQY